MCGVDIFIESLFMMCYFDDFVFVDYFLWVICIMVNKVLEKMDDLFVQMYVVYIKGGCFSIVFEKLLCVMFIQVFYSVCLECQFMEQIQYNFLFCWFIGLVMDDVVWVFIVFSKNCECLIEYDVVIEFFNQIV